MREIGRKKSRVSWKRVLLSVGAFVLLTTAAALTAVLLELRNPYTATGYPGWQEAAPAGMRAFRLPGDWTLEIGEADAAAPAFQPLTLTDAGGTELARGYLFPGGMDAAGFTAAAEAYLGAPVSEYRMTGGVNVSVLDRQSSYQSANFFSGGSLAAKTYCLLLGDAAADLCLWFPYDTGAEDATVDRVRGVICSFWQ